VKVKILVIIIISTLCLFGIRMTQSDNDLLVYFNDTEILTLDESYTPQSPESLALIKSLDLKPHSKNMFHFQIRSTPDELTWEPEYQILEKDGKWQIIDKLGNQVAELYSSTPSEWQHAVCIVVDAAYSEYVQAKNYFQYASSN